MAIRASTTFDSSNTGSGIPSGCLLVVWSGLLNGDTGAPVAISAFANKSIHVAGTFGAGGSVAIEGTNERVSDSSPTFIALRNSTHTIIAVTGTSTTNMEEILENTLQIRPNVTAGDGTTNLTVRLLVQTPARR